MNIMGTFPVVPLGSPNVYCVIQTYLMWVAGRKSIVRLGVYSSLLVWLAVETVTKLYMQQGDFTCTISLKPKTVNGRGIKG